MNKRLRAKGFTLMELLIAVTVASIVLALAMPSYSDFINKRAVKNAAEQSSTFMALARSEAVKRNRPVTVRIGATGGNFCIGLTTDPNGDCDCFTANSCQMVGGDQVASVALTGDGFENVVLPPTLSTLGTAKSPLLLTFDPIRGILDTDPTRDQQAELLFNSENGRFSLQVETSLSGRSEICAPSGNLPGYKVCS